MKFRHKIFSVIVLVTLLAAGQSRAVDYFPSEPGPIFNYESGPVTIGSSGEIFHRIRCEDCIVGSLQSFALDADGNVLFNGYSSFAEAAVCPDGYSFDPPLKYLDFPLETGKSWTSTAALCGIYEGVVDTVHLTGRVAGTSMVTVPAGEFEVIVVYLEFQFETRPWENDQKFLWLHRQLGPVNDLTSWLGVVDTDAVSWGHVKSLYR